MWERECLSSDTLYPCCPSVSFDIGNHPLHCCTSITAPSSHRLPIWLEGIATWFPIWNTPLHFALRHVNILPSLSSPHADEKSTMITDFSFDNFYCLTSNIVCTSNPSYRNYRSRAFSFYWLSFRWSVVCLIILDKNNCYVP